LAQEMIKEKKVKSSKFKTRSSKKNNDLKKEKGNIDLPFLFIIMSLLVIGIIMMFSASFAWAISEGKSGTYYAVEQIKNAVIGLVAMAILSKVDYHIFETRKIAYTIFLVALVLLILVLIIGDTVNGAQRWIKIGITFQPSEIMKFAITIIFSLIIINNQKYLDKYKVVMLPTTVILGIVTILMLLQPHLSGTILMILIGFTVIFVGGVKTSHLLFTGLGAMVLLIIVVIFKITVEGTDYFLARFQSWQDPFADAKGDTWQTAQSLIAIGSGGLFGLGLGESRQKFLYLPETKNDFVFSIVCEELGFIGAVTIILLFVFLVIRGIYIASKSKDKFGMLLCIGLVMQIAYQAFLNIAVVTNLVPNTGIGLPFFSYGGTSLIMLLAQMGIVLNISKQSSINQILPTDLSENK